MEAKETKKETKWRCLRRLKNGRKVSSRKRRHAKTLVEFKEELTLGQIQAWTKQDSRERVPLEAGCPQEL